MISTITASTVSTITTTVLAGSVGLIGVLILLALLIQKELASYATGSRSQRFSQFLNIGIVPLLMAFVLMVAFKIMDVLQ